MLFTCNFEFRGIQKKTSQNGNEYVFISLEDENGESAKFRLKTDKDYSTLKKGQKTIFVTEYDTKYNSLQVIDFKN